MDLGFFAKLVDVGFLLLEFLDIGKMEVSFEICGRWHVINLL